MRPLPVRRADDSIGVRSARPARAYSEGVRVPKRVLLIGHPVIQSLSSALHQAAFDAKSIDARYEPKDVPLIDLPEAIAGLRGDDFLGANITVPFKERVAP